MTKLMSKSPQRISVNIFTEDTHRKKNLYKESRGKILFKSRLNQIPAVPRQQTRIQTSHGQARVWQSDHGQPNHDRYIVTKHVHSRARAPLGRYVATESYRSVATSNSQARAPLGLYVATELKPSLVAT
ncbi:hypothetical protein F2Q68_00011896 [Brassica cretica]|uniref:Uncharacterized protein n=1 Tax=Brassica cretica TaxID=69181 RepID=A0A8S9KUD3_BRACR|nr:hypothetical protein F2Q68_00011896 [Brassica cretica]